MRIIAPMTDMIENVELKNRRIRSFVLRQGRVTKSQERALETQWPKYGVEYGLQSIDLNTLLAEKTLKKF